MSLINNRKEWLKARLKGIGASEAASILGLSPYKSNIELWKEKTGRTKAIDISDKPYVQYGINAEEHLRALFALDFPQYEVAYDQFGMISNNKDLPFAFSTLDGELTNRKNDQKGILEIKTTEILRSGQWDEWRDKIPDHYFCQIIHQLLATEYDFAILKAQIKYTDRNGDKQAAIRHYHIDRMDFIEDINELAQKEKKFWWYVENDKCPPLILPDIS